MIGHGTKIYHPEKSVILDCIVGDDCVIHAPVWIGHGVVIGNRVKIQAFAFIPKGVTIGDDVFIGPHVTFTNDADPPSRGKHWKPTYVSYGSVIGAGATILPGVVIYPGAKVGAGTVVTHDVKAGEWVVGNPCHPISRRDHAEA